MDLWAVENSYYQKNLKNLAGVDEVGRGCLAGPVYAAAVILPQGLELPGLNDSKKLTVVQRERFFDQITQEALAYHVACVEVEEIDALNIFHASFKAMAAALSGLGQTPEMTLVDGKFKIPINLPQDCLVRGDSRSASIAAASILAKVSRDRQAFEWEGLYPNFSFSKHKGYGTPQHLKELREHGPTPLHRRSFAPVRECLTNAS